VRGQRPSLCQEQAWRRDSISSRMLSLHMLSFPAVTIGGDALVPPWADWGAWRFQLRSAMARGPAAWRIAAA
jgi:hypothetical protein